MWRLFLIMLLTSFSVNSFAQLAKDYAFKPVPFTNVHINDHFWYPRIETNKKVTIPYAFQKCEATGRIENFAIAGGSKVGKFQSRFPFDDSDVYKIIEGASYSLISQPDKKLDGYLDSLISLIAAAQEDDGYIMTWRTIDPKAPPTTWSGTEERWSDLDNGHELYNLGHMYEAAVAHYLATNKKSFLDIAIKSANLVYEVFGPGKKEGYPGHQEIEIGLVKLYRLTNEPKYLELAKLFLDRRGHRTFKEKGTLWETGKYWQNHLPVIEQTEAVGHAVRANYMYTAIADVAALTGNTAYLNAIRQIWENMVNKKLYLTGGVGSAGNGEAYGENYELPNRDAYCETCAAIANVFWNHRLFLLTGEAQYIDVLERSLYNGLISGVSLHGDRFFYTNVLESKGEERSEWFSCSCCPSNVSRFIPSVSGYIYALQGNNLFVNLYIGSEGNLKIDGKSIKIIQATQYPWSGDVKLILQPSKKQMINVYLRLPGWAQNHPVPGDLYQYLNSSDQKPIVKINGKLTELNIQNSYIKISREWKKNDTIELSLPMQIHRVIANEQVIDDRGKIALEYGPIVYCAEWPDNQGKVSNLILPDAVALKTAFRPDLLNGVMTLTGTVPAFHPNETGTAISTKAQSFCAIPYYAWAHRGKGEMSVWLPRKVSDIEIIPQVTGDK